MLNLYSLLKPGLLEKMSDESHARRGRLEYLQLFFPFLLGRIRDRSADFDPHRQSENKNVLRGSAEQPLSNYVSPAQSAKVMVGMPLLYGGYSLGTDGQGQWNNDQAHLPDK
jgi:hypothetical protein